MDTALTRSGHDVLHGALPQALLLANGRMASLVSDAGSGGIVRGRLAVTRWVPDRTCDADGQWLYVRDVESGALWSAGLQPVWRTPGATTWRSPPGWCRSSARTRPWRRVSRSAWRPTPTSSFDGSRS